MVVRRHKVQRLNVSRQRSWDESVWLVQIGIWGLAIYVILLLKWTLDSRPDISDRWLAMAVAVVGLAAVVSISLPRISPRRLRRGMVLALCLSLAINLSLMVALSYVRLEPPRQTADSPTDTDPPSQPETTLAEYYPLALEGDDRPEQDERRAVSTGEPNLQVRDLVRKTSVKLDEPIPLQADAVPAAHDQKMVALIPRAERIESAPRRMDTQGTLSRQDLSAQPVLGSALEGPLDLSRPAIDDRPKPAQLSNDPLTSLDRTLDMASDPATAARPPLELPDRLAGQFDEARAESTRAAAQLDVPSITEVGRTKSALDLARRSPRPPIDPFVPRVPQSADVVTPADAAISVRQTWAPESHPDMNPNESTAVVGPSSIGQPNNRAPSADVPLLASIDPLPMRHPDNADQVAPAFVEAPDRRARFPNVQSDSLDAVPLATRPSMAPRHNPVVLPAPRVAPVDLSPAYLLPGDRKPSDLTHLGERSVESSPSRLSRLSGTNAEEIVSPINRPVPAPQALRRALTGLPRSTDSSVPHPHDARTQELIAESAPARPSESHAASSDRRAGPLDLPDVLKQPGSTPVELGARRPSPSTSMERVGGREAPELRRPAVDRLTTRKATGHGLVPALPTDVQRPDFEAQGADRTELSVVSPAESQGDEQPVSSFAAPTIQSSDTAPGAPHTTAALGPPQAIHLSVLDRAPEQVGPSESSPARAKTVQNIPPQSTPLNVPNLPDVPSSGKIRAAPTHLQPAASAERGMVSVEAALSGSVDGPTASESKMADARPSTNTVRDPMPALGPMRDFETVEPLTTDLLAEMPTTPRAPLHHAPRLPNEAAPSNAGDANPATAHPPLAQPGAAGDLSRRSAGAMPVDVAARQGLGGLSSDISIDIGLLNRQAQPESDQIVDSVGRFIRRPIGGPLSIDRTVPTPARAYQTRLNRQGEEPAGGNGRPSPRTEDAIEFGLLYLAEHQRPNGSWSLAEAGDRQEAAPLGLQSDTAATGLALLAFLGAGYHHRSDKYGDVINDGLQFLMEHQREDGDLFVRGDERSNGSAWLYSHGIATIALCEAYGMTQDAALSEPAQKAIDFIVTSQHAERGGWRYRPGVGSDTSVSGWMVMALRSGELANLTVPVQTWHRVESWLELAKVSDARPELYRYNPMAPNTAAQGHGRRASKTMTAVGLLMRMYTGWRRGDSQLTAGANYLLDNPPEMGSARDPQRDTYYWYYATQVMFHMRGDYWERWNEQLHELLTSTQIQVGPLTGSWDPNRPLPDRWAPHAGRLYVTTLNLLSLEVYYRHLPIYEDRAR